MTNNDDEIVALHNIGLQWRLWVGSSTSNRTNYQVPEQWKPLKRTFRKGQLLNEKKALRHSSKLPIEYWIEEFEIPILACYIQLSDVMMVFSQLHLKSSFRVNIVYNPHKIAFSWITWRLTLLYYSWTINAHASFDTNHHIAVLLSQYFSPKSTRIKVAIPIPENRTAQFRNYF